MSWGASPDFAIVKETPFEEYVGSPEVVKELTEPCVKSTLMDFPRAVSAGQEAAWRLGGMIVTMVIGTYLTRVGCKWCMSVQMLCRYTAMLLHP